MLAFGLDYSALPNSCLRLQPVSPQQGDEESYRERIEPGDFVRDRRTARFLFLRQGPQPRERQPSRVAFPFVG